MGLKKQDDTGPFSGRSDYISSEYNLLSHHLYWQKLSQFCTIYAGTKMTDSVPTYFFSHFANSHQYDSSNSVSLHPLLHIHKPAKQPSSKANEVQIIPVLSVGKIQSHILYFLCGQENKAQTLL